MAEPENLVLELLREMRADVRSVRDELSEVRGNLSDLREELHNEVRSLRVVLDNHTLRFDFLEERVERLREATMTALGFAVDASERNKKIETQIADLTERVERLEKAK